MDCIEFSQMLKERISLPEILHKYGQESAGGRSSGEVKYACIYHPDGRPSMSVYDDGHFFCHECRKHGDIFSVVQYYEGMTGSSAFYDSVKHIADMYGIEMPVNKDDKATHERETYFKATRFMLDTFSSALSVNVTGKTGYDLWKERGFNKDFCQEYGLGIYYTPTKHGSLLSLLQKKFGKDFDYKAYGLVNKLGDFPLQNRMIIPIKDKYGNVLSFIGRTIKGDPNKYLPIPNNTFYNKRTNGLFLFDVAKKYNTVIVVEGQMDALALHAAGYTNAVAVGGCEITDGFRKLLAGKSVILAFDNDSAGNNAIIKTLFDYPNDKYFVIKHSSEYKDFNEEWTKSGKIVVETTNSVDYMLGLCLLPDKTVNEDSIKATNLFFNYLNVKFKAAQEGALSAECAIGINPLRISSALQQLNDWYGVALDTNEIINKIYFIGGTNTHGKNNNQPN